MAWADEAEKAFEAEYSGPGMTQGDAGPDLAVGMTGVGHPGQASGYDVSTPYAGGSTGGPQEAFSATDAIGGMANVLDEAADSVAGYQAATMGQGDVSMGADYSGLMQGAVDPAAVMGLDQSAPVTGPEEAFSATDLGDRPSLAQLENAIASVGGDAPMGGGPSDVMAAIEGGEEVAEEVSPGTEVATFLSDFNRGMSAQSPEQGLVAKIDSLQDQAAQLQAQASGGVTAEEAAATASGGGQGWNNPNTVAGQLGILSNRMDNLEQWTGGLQSAQKGYPQPSLDIADYRGSAAQAAATASGGGQGWVDPNASFEELEGQFSTSPQVSPQAGTWQNPNTAYTPLENPNYPAWQNPNTVRPPLEGANFPPDWYNVNEQRAYPTAMSGNLPISAEQAAATATGGGAGWVDPNTVVPDWYNVNEQIAYPTAMGTNLPFMDVPANVTATGTGQAGQPVTAEELALVTATGTGSQPTVVAEEIEATTLAPKYSPQTVAYQTHDQMYPNHRNAAAMAGVASIKAQFDGTHKAWIEAINQDMKDRKIELDHEINGVKTGKHSSGNWKEYDALFTVGEDGVPRDSNGVAMPGTEKQAQAGMAGALQGLWGGILSGAEKLFQPSTSSGVEDPYANLGYPDYASGNIPDNIRQAATVGGDARGDNPIDIIRSSYTWASSLPNNVLFNAARYPDYLRLLIEYDAAGKELPLTVPTWILEGTARPVEAVEEEEEVVTPNYATRQNLTWDTPAWLT
jgi:hypothetical protein